MAFTGVEREQEEEVPQALSSFLHPPPRVLRFPLLDHLLGCLIAAGQGVEAVCLFLHLTRSALDAHIVRLGLATPHDRPLRKSGAKGWSVPDTFLAIFLRLAGVHPEVIGQALSQKRSANAVRTKLRRMGIRGPSRAALFKPDLSSIILPSPEAIARLLRSRDDLTTTTRALRALVVDTDGGRKQGLPLPPNTADGKAEDAKRDESSHRVATAPLPTSEAEVNFNDLSWFRTLVGKNPLTNRVAVYTVGMLILGGLHYKEAAMRLGLSASSYRTFRTRMDVPADDDRKKAGRVFDEEAAKATLLRSGYELRLCMQTQKNWFWVRKNDRGVRISPPCRRKERLIGERSNRITILTRKMLGYEGQIRPTPFAKAPATLSA